MSDSRQSPQENEDGLETQAARLQREFGDEAATYAETRAEAADLRGAKDDAELWQQIEKLVDDEPDAEAAGSFAATDKGGKVDNRNCR